MKQLLALFILTSSIGSYAGNGSSGGGQIFGDQLNPWFLSNTKVVNYCVEISPEFSSLSRPKILSIIHKTISYWKKTLNEASMYIPMDSYDPHLGTQEFVMQEACTSNSDLKFQFGFLTVDQKKDLPNHKQLLGIAYRTHYDEVNLKGKGFVYISPEKGPSRPLSPNLHETPWSFGNHRALELVLIHEMGHIFGLQDDHYADSGIMSAKFADQVTSKENILSVATTVNNFPSPFGCNDDFEGFFKIFVGRIEIPPTQTEVHPDTKTDWENDDLRNMLGLPDIYEVETKTVKSLMDIKINGKPYGKIKIGSTPIFYGRANTPAVSMYFTKKQAVYSNLQPSDFNNHLILTYVKDPFVVKNQQLVLNNGKKFDVFIQFDKLCIPSIGMIHNNEVQFDIFTGL